jgi:hypothetical protein
MIWSVFLDRIKQCVTALAMVRSFMDIGTSLYQIAHHIDMPTTSTFMKWLKEGQQQEK